MVDKMATAEDLNELYRTDRYIEHNPTLHESDSPWKLRKIVPVVDQVVALHPSTVFNVLDVGGGAGQILSGVADHLRLKHGLVVNKYAVDLSPGMLSVQRKNNPDIKMMLNEDVRQMSLHDKTIDLTLMIDVLEHVPRPEAALEELKRVSHYLILKVPLENSLLLNVWNALNRGEPRRRNASTIGHINHYSYASLRSQIEGHAGEVAAHCYTNVCEYVSQWDQTRVPMRHKIQNRAATCAFRVSPALTALIFFDYVMVLVKCR
jgi:SAM-dependent methyltransferase